jgi:3',5'-cyclic AMP phosphodiesterase CpdA
MFGLSSEAVSSDRFTRRGFLCAATAASVAFALPRTATAAMERLGKSVRLGVIADLHHDVMHDGAARLGAFVKEMEARQPDAIMQLGDFAYPNAGNKELIDEFNQSHEHSLHVIGNHDTDAGHTKQQCLDNWGMTDRYYAQNLGGLWLLVLDGNDGGSPTHKGGYPSYVGEEQRKWLKEQLASIDGPVIVVSHQPLAGAFAVDNAEEIQAILGEVSEKVLLTLNGHSHIDDVLRVKNITYMHVNSASYQWVGGAHEHESYSKGVHAKYPWISHTCPYRDSLFATLTVDPESLTIQVEGRQSEWVGKSPAELGVDLDPTLKDGEEVAPRIRDREIVRFAG